MNFTKKVLQKIVLTVILFTISLSSTVSAYAGVGNYTQSSNNLTASSESAPSLQQTPVPALLAIAAAWGAGYAIGTIAHHAWDLFITVPTNDGSIGLVQYNSNDFSNFDN